MTYRISESIYTNDLEEADRLCIVGFCFFFKRGIRKSTAHVQGSQSVLCLS
jgi:hypothetical protein